jgi:hypothetical protein
VLNLISENSCLPATFGTRGYSFPAIRVRGQNISVKSWQIMQNKANLLDTQMSVSPVITKYYENKRLCSRGKNKPKQTQFKALKEMVKTSAGFFQHLAPRICYNIHT